MWSLTDANRRGECLQSSSRGSCGSIAEVTVHTRTHTNTQTQFYQLCVCRLYILSGCDILILRPVCFQDLKRQLTDSSMNECYTTLKSESVHLSGCTTKLWQPHALLEHSHTAGKDCLLLVWEDWPCLFKTADEWLLPDSSEASNDL